jgi:hypothetical protein
MVISFTPEEIPGVQVVASPDEAIQILKDEGFEKSWII